MFNQTVKKIQNECGNSFRLDTQNPSQPYYLALVTRKVVGLSRMVLSSDPAQQMFIFT